MAHVNVYWVDEAKTIVRYDFDGKWTWDDLYPAYNKAIEMETSVTHRVDVILDMTNSKTLPANVLMHMKNISDKQPENIGLSIFVSDSRFINSMYKVGTRFYSKIEYYFRVAPTIEDAMTMIEDARQQSVPKN